MRKFDIRSVLGPATPRIRAAVIGAMRIEGNDNEPYRRLLDKNLCDLVCFDANETEASRLAALLGPPHRCLAHAVGDGSRRTFYRTRAPQSSSLYEPNAALARKFQTLGAILDVRASAPVDTIRLDDMTDLGDIDFLQLDVQGAELDVLRGAARLLQGVTVVQTEVEFAPIYIGQPLFGDIDQALRAAGFLFHRFGGMGGDTIRPLTTGDDIRQPISQTLWADVIYVRDLMRLEQLSPRRLLTLAVVLHEVYESVDLCALVLHVHDKLTGSDFWSPYLTQLTGAPPPERLED